MIINICKYVVDENGEINVFSGRCSTYCTNFHDQSQFDEFSNVRISVTAQKKQFRVVGQVV